ncbi:MAG: DUF4440 domain-containing protein [Bacteroidota bacterium]|nr:DUF4440 domain-containing protein [Bacteroidota bacterium]MDP4196057.1 DUF4440 domain-containing protein [Bacteroidota bacterium]
MEPELTTDPKLSDILEELKKLEMVFHDPEAGSTREDFKMMTEESFWEVGASGNCYSRNFVLDALEERVAHPHVDKWEAKDFYCYEIANNNYLLTYTLIQGERITRRSSIWRRCEAIWKVLYHQGTIVKE